tara:strand:- start:1437 stop:2525 length:1089 start_codon:yes stop_codon:yes gene_type:complete
MSEVTKAVMEARLAQVEHAERVMNDIHRRFEEELVDSIKRHPQLTREFANPRVLQKLSVQGRRLLTKFKHDDKLQKAEDAIGATHTVLRAMQAVITVVVCNLVRIWPLYKPGQRTRWWMHFLVSVLCDFVLQYTDVFHSFLGVSVKILKKFEHVPLLRLVLRCITHVKENVDPGVAFTSFLMYLSDPGAAKAILTASHLLPRSAVSLLPELSDSASQMLTLGQRILLGDLGGSPNEISTAMFALILNSFCGLHLEESTSYYCRLTHMMLSVSGLRHAVLFTFDVVKSMVLTIQLVRSSGSATLSESTLPLCGILSNPRPLLTLFDGRPQPTSSKREQIGALARHLERRRQPRTSDPTRLKRT